VLRSTGEIHACPFAVENPAPHFRLGAVGSAPAVVFESYREFRRWARGVLDPAARERGITSCEMCARRVAELPVPRYPR
jgi:hypothetical protein